MAEGTSLLRKHLGLNLNREFESHRLRQLFNARASGRYFCRSERAKSLARVWDSKGIACKRFGGLRNVGESHRLRQLFDARASGRYLVRAMLGVISWRCKSSRTLILPAER